MIKAIVGVLFVIAIGALIFPFPFMDRTGKDVLPSAPSALSAEQEMSNKKTLLMQDLKKTDELCITQCTLELRQLLAAGNGKSSSHKKQQLHHMIQNHEKMEYLEIIMTQNKASIKEGSLNPILGEQAMPHLQQARTEVSKGKSYTSPPIYANKQTYRLLAVPSTHKMSGIIGIIHQDVLDQVKLHQLKNLRILPYPSDGRFKIESVDSRTLEDKVITHPEHNEGTSHYHVDQVVVKFNNVPSAFDIQQMEREIQGNMIKKLGYTYIFQSKYMDAKAMMSYFDKWSPAYVEPHFLYMTNDKAAPNDALYSEYQWNLPIIETEQGWGITKGKEDVIVAVVDTGVDIDHPDLKGHLLQGYNVFDNQAEPLDDVGHGTHVAGVISALVNNNEGVAGMTWYNKVLPVKVLDQSGAGSTYSVAEGIIWAADHGAKVINMSLGNYAEAQFLHDAVKYAYDKDIVLIAASGNDNTERPGYPAAYPEVFAVAATDSNNEKASFSNYGDYIDVAAPGVNIASTYPPSQYAALSGTSMASPHVAALAALIRSINPLLKNTEVMDIMRQSSQDLGTAGKDTYFGYGLIDVKRALQAADQSASSLNFWPQNVERKLDEIEFKYKSR